MLETRYGRTVMHLVHTHSQGVHLVGEKPKECILKHYFYPSIHTDVKDYCESFPEWEMSTSPLVALHMTEIPFE